MISNMTFRIRIWLNVLVTSFTIRKKDFMILRMVFHISLCYDFVVTKYAMILQLCRVIHDFRYDAFDQEWFGCFCHRISNDTGCMNVEYVEYDVFSMPVSFSLSLVPPLFIVLQFPFAWHSSKTARQASRQAGQVAALKMEPRHRKQHEDEHEHEHEHENEDDDEEHNADMKCFAQ